MTGKIKKIFVLSALSVLPVSAFSHAEQVHEKDHSIKNYTVKMIGIKEQYKGDIELTQRGDTLLITGIVTGIQPGPHGFHVHENHDCSDANDGFKKAGSHFNPNHVKHGNIQHGHMGDLGNIVANKDGVAHIHLEVKKLNVLDQSEGSMLGHSVIIHQGADDESSDSSGNSGARILCGVIGQ